MLLSSRWSMPQRLSHSKSLHLEKTDMSRFSVFCIRLRLRTLTAVLAGFAAMAASTAHANTDGLTLQGEGTLRWFGLKVYEARFFASRQVAEQRLFETPFALELTYARDFSGTSIAQTSADEIKKLGTAHPSQHQRWLVEMQKLFPSVKSGDRLRGVHEPGRGTSFFHNDKPIGVIADPEFSRAFFSIWLDPKTVKPDLRRQLLGLASKN